LCRRLSRRMKTKTFINNLFIFLAFILVFILEVNILGLNPLLVIFIFSVFIYFLFKQKKNANLFSLLAQLILIYLLFLSITDILIKNNFKIYFVPFALFPMLVTVIFSELELSLIMSLALSITFGFQMRSLEWAVLMLNSTIISSLMVWRVRRRSKLIHTGFVAGLVQVLACLFMNNFQIKNLSLYLGMFINGGACGILISGILPFFEYLFGRITNISLLELSDINNPLLKEMILKAPGTYHHSLIVGNLSEAACEAIGADALLSRIGAYYHDIGKINKPQYFIENQVDSNVLHQELSPSMSKLVIINHVREGIELAKKHRLNPRIIDFIEQHHGTSLVYYFYLRALENMAQDSDVDEEGFRYPGPKPKTKETAVVLLADSVEAAARTIKEHTPAKITELVHRIINNKFIDGQLDECDLTLKDLEKIAKVFVKILTSMYHARINYPEKKPSTS